MRISDWSSDVCSSDLQGAMLKVLHMLRGTSLHPSPPRGISNIDEYIGQSARLKKTFEILEEVRQRGEKALLFCEDLEMQAFLAMAIQERFALERRPMCIRIGRESCRERVCPYG